MQISDIGRGIGTRRLRPGQLARGFGWLLGAQLSSRLARLLTTLVVARALSPEHFGLAAIALATNELAGVVARFGTSAAVVQCDEHVLETRCRAAWSLNAVLGIGLFVLQCTAAVLVAHWYASPDLVWPICVLATSYLLLPFGAVNMARTVRRNDMRTVARTEIQQAVADMLLTVTMAMAGCGVWALILPKVVVIPLWIRAHRAASPWTSPGFHLANSAQLLAFSWRVMGVELLNVLRSNLDYLIIGATLGIEALGIYFFAFNAGLGITRGIIGALSSALYPMLCQSRHSPTEADRRFKQGLTLMAIVVCSCVLAQVSLASHYVPLIFGQHWADLGAVPILMLVCLSAIPIAFVEAGAQYLRAMGKPERDLRWHLPFTFLFALALLCGVGWGMVGVAVAVLIVHLVNLPLYYVFNIRPVMAERADPGIANSREELAHA